MLWSTFRLAFFECLISDRSLGKFKPGMSLRVALEALSQRASKYCINLNGLVDRDDEFLSKHGSTAVVYQGTLRPEETKVAIKTLRSDPSSDLADLKVRLLLLHECLPSNLTS